MRHAAIALVLAAAAASSLVAQAPAPRPRFDVATIKRSPRLDAGGTLRMMPGGLFRSVNVDVRGMMLGAYRTAERRLFASQIVGAPAWLASERYDITAKVGDELAARPPEELFSQLPVLLQTLLEDRFRLKLHHETRELPVYVLTMARGDRIPGPQMHPSSADCAADPNTCAVRFVPGHLSVGAVNLETLVGLLSGSVERVVIDRTGLAGRFDVELDWSPDQSATDKPSVFAAVQEQLGLKLESQRAPVDVLVIDHVERPTED